MAITLRQICLVAEELAPRLDDFEAVFGLKVCFVDEGVGFFGLENALMPIGTNLLEIVAPVKEGTAGGRYLERRGGDGGYMVITQASSLEVQDAAKTRAADMGVRIAMERSWVGDKEGERGPGNFLQFHPGDTGGSFFELDWNEVNEPTGFWPPADGDGWYDKINRDVIGDITGVEMQGEDPGALAHKWQKLSALPLEDVDGVPTIAFDNASLRFVKTTDGRGDGLGGLDVTGTDKAKALAAAKDRGLEVEGNQIMICGTRFNLV